MAENLYRNVLLPAATGILMIPSVELFSELWATQWHWFHGSGSIPACSHLWTVGILGSLGIIVVPAVTAILARERAIFATMVGLIVYIPISLTTTLSGENVQRMTSLLAKSCQVDTSDFDADSFGAGMVSGLLLRALMAIFVAKVVSTWLARTNAPTS